MRNSLNLSIEAIKEALLTVFSTPWIWVLAFLLTSSSLADLIIPQLFSTFSPQALRWIEFLSTLPVLVLMVIGTIGLIQIAGQKINKQPFGLAHLVKAIRTSFWDLVFFRVFLWVFILPALFVYLPVQYFLATNSSLAPILRQLISIVISVLIMLGSATIGIAEAALLLEGMKGKQALKTGLVILKQNFLAILLLSASSWLLGQTYTLPYNDFSTSPPVTQTIRFSILAFSLGLSTVVWAIIFLRLGNVEVGKDV